MEEGNVNWRKKSLDKYHLTEEPEGVFDEEDIPVDDAIFFGNVLAKVR